MESVLLQQLRRASDTLMQSKRAGEAHPEREELISTSKAVLMELKSAGDRSRSIEAAGENKVDSAKRRAADADDKLRALKYQRSRLQRSISACAEAVDDEDSNSALLSELISIDDAVLARNDQSTAQAPLAGLHQQMLFRLGVERDERARLREVRDALVAHKARIGAAATKATELKAAVDAQMENVTAAAAALQAELQPAKRGAEPFHALAPLLPSPLYTLALTISAYLQSVDSDAVLHVEGDAKSASEASGGHSSGGRLPRGAPNAAMREDSPDALVPHPLKVS